jgi:circadian clock protein KaiB
MAAKYVLKLYVTGQTANSIKAIGNLKDILKDGLNDICRLEVIDVLKNPQLAEENKIMATPALVKARPPPIKKIIGDLSDKKKVLLGLNLTTG